MSAWQRPHRCSECGSTALRVAAFFDLDDLGVPPYWRITCDQNHLLVPIPGFVIEIG